MSQDALKELAALAGREGALTLSWSQTTLGGSQGAARLQAAMNKMFGTNIRINFVPGPDMARIVNQLATEYEAGQKAHVDIVLGAEARGFWIGSAIAVEAGVGFVPARRPGKLPPETVSATYMLEYGQNALELFFSLGLVGRGDPEHGR